MTEPPELRAYTVEQVATALQLPKDQIYTLIHDGRLAALKAGKHFRIPDFEFERYLRSACADVA